jgi:hypothetical protein
MVNMIYMVLSILGVNVGDGALPKDLKEQITIETSDSRAGDNGNIDDLGIK